jgi:hypothetical protein
MGILTFQFSPMFDVSYRFLYAYGDQAIVNGILLDLSRQVSTFGLSMWSLASLCFQRWDPGGGNHSHYRSYNNVCAVFREKEVQVWFLSLSCRFGLASEVLGMLLLMQKGFQ